MVTPDPYRICCSCSTNKATSCCKERQKPALSFQGVVTEGALLTGGLLPCCFCFFWWEISLILAFVAFPAAAQSSLVSFSGLAGDHFASSYRHVSLPMPLLPSPHYVWITWSLAREEAWEHSLATSVQNPVTWSNTYWSESLCWSSSVAFRYSISPASPRKHQSVPGG